MANDIYENDNNNLMDETIMLSPEQLIDPAEIKANRKKSIGFLVPIIIMTILLVIGAVFSWVFFSGVEDILSSNAEGSNSLGEGLGKGIGMALMLTLYILSIIVSGIVGFTGIGLSIGMLVFHTKNEMKKAAPLTLLLINGLIILSLIVSLIIILVQ